MIETAMTAYRKERWICIDFGERESSTLAMCWRVRKNQQVEKEKGNSTRRKHPEHKHESKYKPSLSHCYFPNSNPHLMYWHRHPNNFINLNNSIFNSLLFDSPPPIHQAIDFSIVSSSIPSLTVFPDSLTIC